MFIINSSSGKLSYKTKTKKSFLAMKNAQIFLIPLPEKVLINRPNTNSQFFHLNKMSFPP